ncbi:MAG TPA: hypothetical protein VK112_00895 [Fodinibius sp.]|nr:hypothetical protein [Fodinibius sp.]
MAKQIAYLMVLRFKMGIRLIKDLGWPRVLVLLIFFAVMMMNLFTQQGVYAQWSMAFLGCTITGFIHFRRRDIFFLRSVSYDYRFLLAAEYLLVTSPLLLMLLYNGVFVAGILLICFLSILPFFNTAKTNQFRNKEAAKFPALLMQAYEWTAGLRKNGIGIALVIILGFGLVSVHYLVPLASIFGLTAIVASFYSKSEPSRFIQLTADSPSSFLLKKVSRGIGLYVLCTLPLWAATIAVYPAKMWYTALFWLANNLLLVAVITAKYALFEEQRNMEIPLSIIFVIISIFLIIPYLQFAVPLVILYFWMKAICRLRMKVYAYT